MGRGVAWQRDLDVLECRKRMRSENFRTAPRGRRSPLIVRDIQQTLT